MTSWRRAFPLVASAMLLLASCGNRANSPAALGEPRAPETTTAPIPPPLASEGPPAPRDSGAVAAPAGVEAVAAHSSLLTFKAPAIGGGQVDATTFQGRPTLLWFWAPW